MENYKYLLWMIIIAFLIVILICIINIIPYRAYKYSIVGYS